MGEAESLNPQALRDWPTVLMKRIRTLVAHRYRRLPYYVEREDLVSQGLCCVLEALHRRKCASNWAAIENCARRAIRHYLDDQRHIHSLEVSLDEADVFTGDGMADDVASRLMAEEFLARRNGVVADCLNLRTEGFTQVEVGQQLGMSRDQVQGRMERLRSRLSKIGVARDG